MYGEFGTPHTNIETYYISGGELTVKSDFNGRLINSDEMTTINDIMTVVNRVYRKYADILKTSYHVEYVHLYGNCNDDNDISVVYSNGCEQFEIRYCAPCANWFVSYHIISDDGIEPTNRINELQLNNDLPVENVVQWLFTTMSLLDF